MVYTIFAVIAIALDQWLKWWTSNNMVSDEIKSFIPGLLTLTNIHNEGAAFGMFTGGRFWFILIAGIFCLIVIIALAADWIKNPLARWSAVMVAAGGVGNCIDRVILGYVQDMFRFDFKIFGYEFPVFNIADIFITVFAIIFMLCVLLGDDKPKAKKAAYDDEEDDEDYEEEDEEAEVKPKKAGRFGALSGAAGRFMRKGVEEYEDEDEEEEEEDDEEDPAPVKMRSSRKPAPVDEVDDDDEDEEEEPVKKHSFFGFRSNKSSDYEDDDDDEEEEPAPAPGKSAPAAEASNKPVSRRAAQKQKEKDFDNLGSSPVSRKSPAAKAPSFEHDEDPFAAWERANSRFTGRPDTFSAASTYSDGEVGTLAPKSAKAVTTKRTSVPKTEDDNYEFNIDTFSYEKKNEKPAESVKKTAAKPAAPKAPAPAKAPARKAPVKTEAPKPEVKSTVTSTDDFDLDSILNEFR